MNFANSSQAKQFLFTPEQLTHKRHESYERTRSFFSVSLSESGHLRYVNYYCDKLLQNSRKIGFNRFQRYTALALMQRVYLSRTLWEIPPPLAMISCLFLVSKFIKPETIDSLIGNLGYGTDFYAKFRPQEQMAHVEIDVLTALDFKLKVHLPFHQVVSLCYDQPFAAQCEECQQQLFDMLRTDALLLYPPGQIAVAAVAKVVGPDVAIAAAGVVAVPDDLGDIVQRILALEPEEIEQEEIEQYERQIGEELSVFQTLNREKEAQKATDRATSMFPP
jgi:hypothetical protein